MANTKRNAARTARTARTTTTTAPTTVATIHDATTIDGIVAFARTITAASFVAALTVIRNTFTVAHAARNVGRTTNRRVTDFQNWSYVENVKWQLDDVQLAAVWVAEFPAAVGAVFMGHPSDIIRIVRAVRAQFNAGKHGTAHFTPGMPACVAYGDVARMKPDAMFPRVAAVVTPPVVIPTVPASAHTPAKRAGKRRVA